MSALANHTPAEPESFVDSCEKKKSRNTWIWETRTKDIQVISRRVIQKNYMCYASCVWFLCGSGASSESVPSILQFSLHFIRCRHNLQSPRHVPCVSSLRALPQGEHQIPYQPLGTAEWTPLSGNKRELELLIEFKWFFYKSPETTVNPLTQYPSKVTSVPLQLSIHPGQAASSEWGWVGWRRWRISWGRHTRRRCNLLLI